MANKSAPGAERNRRKTKKGTEPEKPVVAEPDPFKVGVEIFGDVNIETFVAKLPNRAGDNEGAYLSDSEWECRRRPGGAWLLKSMINAYCEETAKGRNRCLRVVKTQDDNEAESDEPAETIDNERDNVSRPPLKVAVSVAGAASPYEPQDEDSADPVVFTPGYPEWAIQLRPYPKNQHETRKSLVLSEAVFRVYERLGRVGHRSESGGNIGEKHARPQNLFDGDHEDIDTLEDPPSFDDSPSIVVINDRAEGFRQALKDEKRIETTLSQRLVDRLSDEATEAIVWLLYQPADTSVVWVELEKSQSKAKTEGGTTESVWDRLVIVINEDCLRDAGVDVRFDIAFEEVVQTILTSKHPFLAKLLKARHVLIRFGNGVVHLSRACEASKDRSKGKNADLNAKSGDDANIDSINIRFIEDFSGSWRISDHGSMEGYTFLLASCLVHDIAWAMNDGTGEYGHNRFSRLPNAIDWSLYLGCKHQHLGYGSIEDLQKGDRKQAYGRLFRIAEQERFRSIEEPGQLLVDASASPVFRIGVIGNGKESLQIKAPLWNLRHKRLGEITRLDAPPKLTEAPHRKSKDFYIQVVLEGIQRLSVREEENIAVKCNEPSRSTDSPGDSKLGDEESKCVRIEPSFNLPFARFGGLQTADRNELSNFFAVERLLERYLSSEREWETPLAIGVFGPPGSGKNYTIKELIAAANSQLAEETLTFNLSQFETSDQLWRALREVQDRVVAKKTPVVIFDEFDSALGDQPLAWLKYFLSPIQDGKFYDGNSTYNLGRSIMVFAGGTSECYVDFKRAADEDVGVAAKAPDFVSRLRGYLDIDPIEEKTLNSDPSTQPPDDYDPPASIQFRRAIVLRGLLKKNLRRVIDPDTRIAKVDPDVVKAFLTIPKFRHGVRSMEALLQMSTVSTVKDALQKSSLPTFDQLNMHVDAATFLRIVNRH